MLDDGMRTDPSFWPREGKPELSYSFWHNPLGDTGVSALGLCSMAPPGGRCARQGDWSSGASGREEQSGVGPCEAVSVTLPGFGQWGLVELNEGGAKGKSTLFSAGSQVLDQC